MGLLVWESITAVAVIDDALPELEVFQNLGDTLAGVADDSEIVIIANGVSALATKKLQAIVERVPDVTVHFLAARADRDTAMLLAIERALGDWIVVLTPSVEEVSHLPPILAKLGPCEIVFVGSPGSENISGHYNGLVRRYLRASELISRISTGWRTPRIRIYTRAAGRYLANHLDGEFMLFSLTLNGAFPGEWETVEGWPAEKLVLPTLPTALRRASRGMLGASAVPLRATVGIALATGLLAMLNSLYAVIVFLVKPDVEPGWTTLSLQISMMMFLFSIMFALLAGYVLSVYRSIPPRRRNTVIREIRSPLRRQDKRLNVVGGNGQFHLGA